MNHWLEKFHSIARGALIRFKGGENRNEIRTGRQCRSPDFIVGEMLPSVHFPAELFQAFLENRARSRPDSWRFVQCFSGKILSVLSKSAQDMARL